MRRCAPFLRTSLAFLLLWQTLQGAEVRGKVTFNGLPVPGATVTATQGERRIAAVTDQEGGYAFDLDDGWSLEVGMLGFAPAKQNAANGLTWELKMLPLGDIKAEVRNDPPPSPSAPKPTPAPAKPTAQPAKQTALATRDQAPPPAPDSNEAKAADGFLINGSVNNGASSPFAQFQGFGNRSEEHTSELQSH